MPFSNKSRSRACAMVAASAVMNLAGLSHAASVEFFGSTFTSGTSTIPFDVSGGSAEMLFGTYSYSGGTTPGAVTVGSGGMDSQLTLVENGVSQQVNDDLNINANLRDSEIRTTGYAGTGRTGAVVRPALTADNYSLQLFRFTGTGGPAWSVAIASTTGTAVVHAPTLAPGQTIDTVLATAGGRLTLNTATTLTAGLTTVELGSSLSLSNNATLNGDLRVTGNSSVFQSASTVNAGTIQLGNLANSTSTYAVQDAMSVLNVTNLSLGTANSADVYLLQNAGTVTASNVVLGSASASGEKSAYRIIGGTLIASSLTSDGSATNYLDLQGGNVRLTSPASTNITTAGSTLLWGSGSLEFTSVQAILDLRRIFGSGLTLNTGQKLIANASTWNAPVTLNGGALAVPFLQNTAPLTWNSGTVELTSSAGTALGTSSFFGSLLTLSAGRTLVSHSAGYNSIGAGSTVLVQGGGRLAMDYLQNGGDLTLAGAGATVDAIQLVNDGFISGSGLVRGQLTNDAGASISLAATDSIRLEGALINNGAIKLTGGAFTATGTVSNGSAATITGRGTFAASTLTNSGIATFSAGVSDLDAAVNNSSGGKVIVTGGGTLTVYKPVTNATGSEFRVSQGASVAFLGNVSGLSAFTGTGTKYFEGGTSGGALLSGGASVVEASGSLVAAGINESSLIVRGPAKLSAGSPTSKLNAIAFEGGSLDLSDNKLVIDYAGASPAAAIRAAIINGSLFSSATPAAGRKVGYAEASALNLTSFGGVAVDATAVVIRWTLAGDVTLDGIVNFNDLVALAQNYNGTGKVWSQGDFNYDGKVDFNDLVSLAQNYNGTLSLTGIQSDSPAFADDWALARSLVPEPATLVAAVAPALLLRRRRQST